MSNEGTSENVNVKKKLKEGWELQVGLLISNFYCTKKYALSQTFYTWVASHLTCESPNVGNILSFIADLNKNLWLTLTWKKLIKTGYNFITVCEMDTER